MARLWTRPPGVLPVPLCRYFLHSCLLCVLKHSKSLKSALRTILKYNLWPLFLLCSLEKRLMVRHLSLAVTFLWWLIVKRWTFRLFTLSLCWTCFGGFKATVWFLLLLSRASPAEQVSYLWKHFGWKMLKIALFLLLFWRSSLCLGAAYVFR